MDGFTFLIAIILMLIAVTYHQNWIIFGVIAIMILTQKNLTTLILMAIGGGALYFISISGMDINAIWPFLVFGFIILALILGIGKKEQGAGMFGGGAEDPFAGGGYGGMGGY